VQFLVKKHVMVITHPPYSSDLAAADYFLFLKLKLANERDEDVTSIQRAASDNTSKHDSERGIFSRIQKFLSLYYMYGEGKDVCIES
jgi:hypothetical protein